MPSYRKGTLIRNGNVWSVRDEQDGKESRLPDEKLVTFEGELEVGAPVEYTRQPVSKTTAAMVVKEIRVIGESSVLPHPVRGTIPAGFVNPYNFVPLAGHVPRSHLTSHEYFRGYSGSFSCHMTLKTPFFTPDSAEVYTDENDHQTLRLLRDPRERGLIPGSTLKGMVRSVAEVLSNSCLSVLDLEARFSWRNVDDGEWRDYWKGRRIGVVEGLPVDGKPGWIAPAMAAKIYFNDLPPNKISRDGDPATATVVPVEKGLPKATNVQLGHTGVGERGYLKITEIPENNEQRRTQRFVYAIKDDQNQWLQVEEQVVRDYNQATEPSRELDARRREIFLPPDFLFTLADPNDASRGLREKRHPLRVGDIVYYVIKKGKVVRLGPVELSRVMYENAIAKGVPKEFQPCSEPTRLCPCCCLFGWIPPARHGREGTEARAGFISISPALTERRLTNADIHEARATLRPLGQPHPTAVNFYLQQQDGADKPINITIHRLKFADESSIGIKKEARRAMRTHAMMESQSLIIRTKPLSCLKREQFFISLFPSRISHLSSWAYYSSRFNHRCWERTRFITKLEWASPSVLAVLKCVLLESR